MTKLALVALRQFAKTVDYDVQVFMQVHDSIMCYVPEDKAEEWQEHQRMIMIESGKVFINVIPVEVDMKISDQWEK